MKKRLLAMMVLGGMVCGCEAPVEPGKVKVAYFESIAMHSFFNDWHDFAPADSIWVISDRTTDQYWAEPGQKIELTFRIRNEVRDEVFLEFGESTAYVSSVVAYLPGEANGTVYPVSAPTVNPQVSAAPYRHLLAYSKGGTNEGERSLEVKMPVELPKTDWERVEVSVVISIHGFTRETKGEFRDTVVKKFGIGRRTPASAPAKRVVPGGSGLIYSRPTSGPATEPALRR